MILTKVDVNGINLDELIQKKIKDQNLNQLLLIVPTNRKIRSLKKELISESPQQVTAKINLETIGTFSTKILFGDHSSNSRVLSEEASILLLKQSFNEVELKYFSHYKKEIPFGTLERVKNVISEYKRHGITPDKLLIESRDLSGSEKIKAIDIAEIYKVYQKKIEELNVKEIGDVYSGINNLNTKEFELVFRELYESVDLIIINGFDEFTSPEIDIINSISLLKNTELFLSFDYYKLNPVIFSHLDSCYDKLVKKGFNKIEDLSPSNKNEFHGIIRKNLFSSRDKKTNDNFEDKIVRIICPNRDKEIEFIAKEIKQLITKSNIEPQKICIVFNLINKYSPVIRDIFNLYNIPFNLTDRFSLSTSAPVISIINFLEILENDFYYKNLFRALSGSYINIEDLNLSYLLKSSVDLKIIAGYENWRTSLKDAVEQINEYGSEENGNYSVNKEIYKKALEDIEKIYEALSNFNKEMPLDEFRENLFKLIFSMDIPNKLINNGDTAVEENIKALTTFIETIDEIIDLFKLEYGAKAKFKLKFYLNQIRTAVSSARYNIKEKPGFGVQITTMNEIRGLQFDYLFISGLCDGDFPTRFTPEIFFSGSFKKSEYNHQTEERYHFYQSLCSWENGLYLTFPMNEEKKELVESNFLTEFTSLFKCKNKDQQNYKDLIFSREELLKLIGEIGVDEFKKKFNDETDLRKIEKAIGIDSLRLNEPFGDSEFTGNILKDLNDESKKELENYKHKQFSITQLETYAKCPYKYFAERVLKLQTIEEPTEEIEALELGSILHVILFKFYSEIRKKGIVLFNCNDEEFNFAKELIFKIAEEIIEQVKFNSPLSFYEKEKILGINENQKESILYKFLIAERENKDGYIPEFFEIGFGKIEDGNKHIQVDVKIDDINVRGKIDRLDINSSNESYKVVDYKLSGKKPTTQDLTEGISLQLPLYMYAAKELIKTQLNKDYEPAGSEIYSLKVNEKDFGKNLVKTGRITVKEYDKETVEKLINMNNEIINISLDSIKNYVNSIINGKFNLSTLSDRENKVCRFCSFRPICRIQEVD